MNPAELAVQDLSRRLIALEAQCDSVAIAGESRAVRVCEKLRLSLVKFAGVAGYRALVSRALSMAKAEAPSLEPVQVRQDGSMEGFDRIGTTPGTDAADIILVHLLSLLVTLIGERQTLALVRAGWTDDRPVKTQLETEEPS
jgi:hypothetical protein